MRLKSIRKMKRLMQDFNNSSIYINVDMFSIALIEDS